MTHFPPQHPMTQGTHGRIGGRLDTIDEREQKHRHLPTQQFAARPRRFSANVLDREQVEEAQLGYETAKAGVLESEARIKAVQAFRDETKARWSKAVSDVRAGEASRKVAEKNRDYIKAQVGYMQLTAPYDGIVTHRGINTRDFVQTAEAGSDQPLYVVRRTDLFRIFVQVPESGARLERAAVADAGLQGICQPIAALVGREARAPNLRIRILNC